MTYLSLAKFGALHGVTGQAAAKWKSRGLIVIVGGKVDVEASNKKLKMFRKGGAPGAGAVDETDNQIDGIDNQVDETDNRLTDQKLLSMQVGESAASAAERILKSTDMPVTLDEAKLMKEKYLALLNQFEYERKSGQVIDLDVAEAVFFELFRAQRDAWMNWPIRVGPVLAADLGLEAEAVTEALTALVHKQISSLGQPEPNFDET